jgi:hypothetical protein
MSKDKGIVKSLILSSSLLLIIIVVLIVFYANSLSPSSLFPTDNLGWNRILTVYLVVFGLVLTAIGIYSPKTLKALVQANYWKSFFVSFVPNFIVASIFLLALKLLLKNGSTLNIFNSIASVPLAVLFVHLFVVSQIEEIMFKGLIYNSIKDKTGSGKTATFGSVSTFVVWHFAKTGGSIPALVTYVPLRLMFNYISENGVPYLRNVRVGKYHPFGATQRTVQAGASWHFSWNLFVISFLGG